MSQPLAPELEAQAQKLAARIQKQSADAILDMARTLVATTDETLFGDTEFTIRDQTHRILAHAYAEHLEKKVTTTEPPSTAPSATPPRRSTTTAKKPSKHSAEPSPSTAPTTTADPADTDSAPATTNSD